MKISLISSNLSELMEIFLMYKKSIPTPTLVQPQHDQLTVYISRESAALFS